VRQVRQCDTRRTCDGVRRKCDMRQAADKHYGRSHSGHEHAPQAKCDTNSRQACQASQMARRRPVARLAIIMVLDGRVTAECGVSRVAAMAASRCWPSPVRSRRCSAVRMAMVAFSPAQRGNRRRGACRSRQGQPRRTWSVVWGTARTARGRPRARCGVPGR
jgi:hypothetical protein